MPIGDLLELKRLERHTLVSAMALVGLILLMIVGSHLFSWSWG
jgi:hypothetical protein